MVCAVTDHGEVNESFVMARVALVITRQPACFDQPAEGALHDPAFGRQDEAFGRVTALDDREHQSCGMSNGLARRSDKAFEFARVAAVDKDDAQGAQQVAEHAEDHLRRIAILRARRVDGLAEQQALRLGEDVALAACDLFYPHCSRCSLARLCRRTLRSGYR